MIKKILPFSISVLKVNLVISSLATFFYNNLFVLSLEEKTTATGIMTSFVISFLTGGFLLGFLFFEFFHRQEYYLFYNLGIGKLRLILVTYLFHIFIVTLIISAYYAKYI